MIGPGYEEARVFGDGLGPVHSKDGAQVSRASVQTDDAAYTCGSSISKKI